MSWMLKNSAGKEDGVWTCAVIGLSVVIFCLLAPMFNGFQIPWTKYILNINTPDNTLAMSVLGATFTSYVVRRNKKDQIVSDEVKEGYNVPLP